MRVPRIVLVAGMEPSAFTCTPASMLEVRGRERDEEKTTRSRKLYLSEENSRSSEFEAFESSRVDPTRSTARISLDHLQTTPA